MNKGQQDIEAQRDGSSPVAYPQVSMAAHLLDPAQQAIAEQRAAAQLWTVYDSAGKVYGQFDRVAARETLERVQSENSDLESVGMCVAGMEPVQAPAWFSKPLEET